MSWNIIVIIICVVLALAFMWQEYRRANKARLYYRLMAVLAAAVALACIALPLTYNGRVSKNDEHKVALLTAGFDADSLKGYTVAKLLTIDKAVKQAYPKAQLISGLDEIDTTEQLHIYGYGLNVSELRQLNNIPLTFHPEMAPAGVSNISWKGQFKAGEELRVQGLYNNTSAQKVKLVLKGLHTGLDSMVISPNTEAAFELSTTPKATGRILYTLQADTTTQGNLPVQVDATKPLKVLMLSASPDFEARFLKNWLSSKGYAVAVRSAISKGKYNSEYINISQFSLDRLSAPVLGKFDVVIGDLSVLNGLNGPEAAALKQEVADNGLGIIVRADSTGKTSWLQSSFPVDRPSGKESAPAAISINGKKSSSNKLSTGSAYIVYKNGTQPLVNNGQGHILANSTIMGSGKVIFTTLNNTFSWTLAGNQQDYSALWSALISKAARKADSTENIPEVLSSSYLNEPVQVQTVQNKFSQININHQVIPAVQDPGVPFEWIAQYWPSSIGWQVVSQGGKTGWWYTYSKNDWKTIQATDKLAATTKYAGEHTNPAIVTKQIQQKVKIAVPKIYFYILLLLACTFLWIETKFS